MGHDSGVDWLLGGKRQKDLLDSRLLQEMVLIASTSYSIVVPGQCFYYQFARREVRLVREAAFNRAVRAPVQVQQFW